MHARLLLITHAHTYLELYFMFIRSSIYAVYRSAFLGFGYVPVKFILKPESVLYVLYSAIIFGEQAT